MRACLSLLKVHLASDVFHRIVSPPRLGHCVMIMCYPLIWNRCFLFDDVVFFQNTETGYTIAGLFQLDVP